MTATRNYLRVRGEYYRTQSTTPYAWELPPRARRIPAGSGPPWRASGTTSACAENTRPRGHWGFSGRNYLRVRGEYRAGQVNVGGVEELPPRARRILAQKSLIGERQGTTSACAENTWAGYRALPLRGNYLRVRGEYRVRPRRSARHSELPPRARRIR